MSNEPPAGKHASSEGRRKGKVRRAALEHRQTPCGART
jgi:hypothetical protein